ncbi:MAG: tRNA uridine-5-carboxymethylaminomethyl(34) synthesis GTPase MnmE [Flavobacteriaceae bacterium]|nr:tRNA uridine-5-carboxymethylaminomethyl(34) synthesis GTPase MnmE [Flavobacteriaceae bacterium]NNK73486.1 tRNA uridine-5-carboxymethylaminomethyl(34) synthesis GTPase MnmE [Flavobacteriaceae bacterium]
MDTTANIIALATPPGTGAIAVIRISGADAIQICGSHFRAKSGKSLIDFPSHTIHLGHLLKGEHELDEVLVSIFKAPHSYTGENVVEISCHGSPFIQREIIQLFLRHGCRTANPGEFTLRAFLNGKLDLSQAEAVADLIASENEAAHQVAMQQMRGGFSHEIQALRQELLNFASLIELELDFTEEDVEFANRDQFKDLVERIIKVIRALVDSFEMGNVIKTGIPVAIIGKPNVGKSTLLNALLKEEKAIVSDIAGTTRDAIEDEITLGGIGFRFIDTAGIRETDDVVESIGIRRTFEKIEQARLILYLIDASDVEEESVIRYSSEIKSLHKRFPDKPIVLLLNKIDLVDARRVNNYFKKESLIDLSAKKGSGIEKLKARLLDLIETGALKNHETIVSNSRHYDALQKALNELEQVKAGIEEDLSGDLLAIDIRQALYHLGEITGEITNDELLGNIFANFCIGK